MDKFGIDGLVSLLKQGEVSKEELISSIQQIQFEPVCLPDVSAKTAERKDAATKGCPYTTVTENCQTAAGQSTSTVKVLSRPPLNIPAKSAAGPKKMHNKETAGLKSKPPLGKVDASKLSKEPYDYSKFFKRIEGFQFYKKAQLVRREELARSIEMKECKFKPDINAQHSTPRAKIRSRLYQHSNDKLQQLRLEQLTLQNSQVETSCTFHPSTNSGKPKAPRIAAQRLSLRNLNANPKSRNLHDTESTVFSNCAQVAAKGSSRNDCYKMSQSAGVEQSKGSHATPARKKDTLNFGKSRAENSGGKLNALSHKKDADGGRVEKGGKGQSKVAFDFEMFKRNMKTAKNAKEALNKFRNEISNYKKTFSTMQSHNTSFANKA